MTFLWPTTLWLFALMATLPFAYVWLLRRRKRALKVSSISIIREAVAGKTSVRRHLPPVFFFLAVLVMGFALARPTALVTLPSERATIMLAIDVSGSMRAQDVEPNRIVAAQQAARTFIEGQPRHVLVGIAAFAGFGEVIQEPTLNRTDLFGAIDSLQLQRRTAVGSGLVAALQALFPEIDLELLYSREPQAAALGTRQDPQAQTIVPVPPGSYASAVIILLTDGRTNAGIDPVQAANWAADRGVKVYTIGFGSPQGVSANFEGGRTMRTALDEEALKAIADITKGKYYNAQTSTDLQHIYKSLSAQFVAETKRTELTGMIAIPALVLLLLAGVLSLIWSNRMT